MGGGNQRMIINFRERLISDDTNRAQRFLAKDRNDLLFYLANIEPANVFDVAGACDRNTSIPTTIGTPLRADVFRGLTVLPISGTSSLHISPGAVGMWDRDGLTGSSDPAAASDDDSDYKVVVSDGIQTNGVLLITANAGPGIRIDVIECQRTETVIETDTRDVFNPATGLFTPNLVDKVTRGELTFRVRAGTAGAGYPGNVQGWLPLAVASVPAGSSTTDDITFWDVRPVASDRWNAPYRNNFLFPLPYRQFQVFNNRYAVPGESRVAGRILTTKLDGSFAGGTIYKGTPTVPFGTGDVAYVDAENAENQEPGFAGFVSGTLYYLWCLFPHGLPRWVRYVENPISGQRVPFGMRGIPTVSIVGPLSIGDFGSALAITPPASTGLTAGSATTDAALVAVSAGTSTAALASFVTDGDWIYLENDTGLTGRAPHTTVAFTQDQYTFAANTDYPANADAVLVNAQAILTGTGTVRYESRIDVADAPGGNILGFSIDGGWETFSFDGGAGVTISATFAVPINTLGTIDFNVTWGFNTTAGTLSTKTTETAIIRGWKFAG